MALPMERPAPALTMLDGGRIAVNAAFPQGPHPLDTRAYLEELINGEPYYLSVKSIDDFADTLAEQYPQRDPLNRGIAHIAMIAHMDGWIAGNDEGYDRGADDAHDFCADLLGRARALIPHSDDHIARITTVALDWFAARIQVERAIENKVAGHE